MLPADIHLHSTVSFDGHNSRTEMALAARDRGIRTICFTDHYDVVNEKNEFVPVYDWTPVRREHQEAVKALGNSIELLYGLELGNAPANFSAAARALEEPGLDFVLGSIHNSGQELGWSDYYYVKFDSPELSYVWLDDYFTQEERLVEWGNFDSLAHLPYPLRYIAQRDGQPVTLKRYEERIVEILCMLIQNGKALEVNSGKNVHIMPEYGWLLERYRDLGGELVTVGCDAHRSEDVGVGLGQAYDLIRSKGFRYITVFRGRKPCPVRL